MPSIMRNPILLSLLCVLAVITVAASQKRYTIDLKVKYFSSVFMVCDHPELNITQKDDVRSLTWIFPDTTTVDSNTYLSPRDFILSRPDASVSVAGDRSRFEGYNLTVRQVNVDVYGYYTCIVVYETADTPSVIRWGLNVDGADYSELMESYREGAIIGGVAAAIFFVLVVGTCLLWHYCFSDNRGVRREEDEDGDLDEILSGKKREEHTYSNQGYNGGIDPSAVDLTVEGPNGLNTKM